MNKLAYQVDGKALKQSKERWPFLLKLTICGDLAEI